MMILNSYGEKNPSTKRFPKKSKNDGILGGKKVATSLAFYGNIRRARIVIKIKIHK